MSEPVVDQQPVAARAQPVPAKNGVGLAALIVGIVAMLFSVIPFLSFVAWVPALVAIGLGIGGLVVKHKKRPQALIGLILGVLAIIVGIVVSIASVAGVASSITDSIATSGPVASEAAPSEEPDEEPAADGGEELVGTTWIGADSDGDGTTITLSADNAASVLVGDFPYEGTWTVTDGSVRIAVSTQGEALEYLGNYSPGVTALALSGTASNGHTFDVLLTSL